jgi:hypothetical protein
MYELTVSLAPSYVKTLDFFRIGSFGEGSYRIAGVSPAMSVKRASRP